jgi:cytochrome P450
MQRPPVIDFDPYGAAMSQDPYPAYRQLRVHDPIHYVAARDMWALSRYCDVREALRDWEAFSNAPSAELSDLGALFTRGGNMLDADPPLHDELRKTVRSPFGPRRIAELEPHIKQRVDVLLDGIDGGADGTPDLAQGLAWALPTDVVCLLLGVPDEHHDQLLQWLDLLQTSEPGQTMLPPAAHEASPVISEYFLDLIAYKTRVPADDVLTHLAQALAAGQLTPDQIPGMCSLLFTAGIETTAGLLSNGLRWLAEFPAERRKLVEDPSLIPDAVEELLRFDAPVQYLARTTTRPVRIGDSLIPADARVVLLYASANRDDAQFEEPDQLVVSRRPRGHLSFGDGLHRCLGAPLARLEAKVALRGVLDRFPEYALDGQPEMMPGLSLRALGRVPVTLRPD